MKNLSLLLFALAGTFGGCKKADPAPPTATQLLTGKKWQATSASIILNAPGATPTDTYALTPPCFRDDFERFDAPNTFTYDEGPTKCFAADPQTQLGLWAFSRNDTQLIVTYAGLSALYTVDELTATSLKVHSVSTNSNGVDETSTVHFMAIP